MSACIIVAQLVTIPAVLLIGRVADRWGRKPLLLIAVAALPLRGLLCAVLDNPLWLIAAQVLDGVGFGVFDALIPLLLADILRGTGRYNVSRASSALSRGWEGPSAMWSPVRLLSRQDTASPSSRSRHSRPSLSCSC